MSLMMIIGIPEDDNLPLVQSSSRLNEREAVPREEPNFRETNRRVCAVASNTFTCDRFNLSLGRHAMILQLTYCLQGQKRVAHITITLFL